MTVPISYIHDQLSYHVPSFQAGFGSVEAALALPLGRDPCLFLQTFLCISLRGLVYFYQCSCVFLEEVLGVWISCGCTGGAPRQGFSLHQGGSLPRLAATHAQPEYASAYPLSGCACLSTFNAQHVNNTLQCVCGALKDMFWCHQSVHLST